LATIGNTSKNIDKSLNETTKTINDSLKSATANLNRSLRNTTKNLNKTLRSTTKLMNGYNSNSLFGRKMTDMLKEIHESTEETKYLLHKINKKPNSLIFGE